MKPSEAHFVLDVWYSEMRRVSWELFKVCRVDGELVGSGRLIPNVRAVGDIQHGSRPLQTDMFLR